MIVRSGTTVVALLLGVGACGSGTPPSAEPEDFPDYGRRISDEELCQLSIGTTTIEEVKRAFGRPGLESRGCLHGKFWHFLQYDYDVNHGPRPREREATFFDFDPEGRLASVGRVRLFSQVTMPLPRCLQTDGPPFVPNETFDCPPDGGGYSDAPGPVDAGVPTDVYAGTHPDAGRGDLSDYF